MLTQQDIAMLRTQAEEDKRRLIQEATIAAEAEYAATIAAIERVESLLARRNVSGSESTTSMRMPVLGVIGDEANGHWPGLRAAIRLAIATQPNAFTLDDVVAYLERHYPERSFKRVAVSGELWRMNQKEEISVIEKGTGNRQNVYRKEVRTGSDGSSPHFAGNS